MTEKSAQPNTTLIVVALIGAIGGIFAACIGLIPTILPMVRPTATPLVFVPTTTTMTPSDTPAPETPSATFAPTDPPTLTATITEAPTEALNPTETPTVVVTPASSSSDIDDYVGTWTTVDEEPGSQKVRLIVTRIEVAKTGDATADFTVCRAKEDGEELIQPNPAPATMYAFGLAARDFAVPDMENLRWAVIIQRAGEQLVATVQEYDTNNTLLNADTFQFEKPSLLGSISLDACDDPAAAQ